MEKKLPFTVFRTFWIYGSDGQTRGGHRHNHTRQAFVALSGVVQIYLNDGVVSETVGLAAPNQCLLVEPKDWHTMTFGAGGVLLVLSSHPYDRSEYVNTPYENNP
jgi:mannose-6-phosphate isomerase-like protein (cupin superfamily)